ncbi:MFS transporter [Vibrio parahaemolyticus]|nr:MFS transporter [Vibrio parahaemolyticus]EHH1258770.1 MFS transporter [Vibrio parahaemolyticus]
MLNNHRFIYFGIMIATMLDSFAVGILLPVLPFIVLDLGENAFWVGALFSIQFIGGALGSPILGKLSDSIPRVALLILSLACIALGNWALLWASSLFVLFAVRAVVGFMSSNLVIFESIISEISSDDDRSAGLARLRIGSTIGLILGPAFAVVVGQMSFVDPRTDMIIVASAVSSVIPFIIALTFKGEITKLHASHSSRLPYSKVFKTFRSNAQVRDFSLIKMLVAVCFGLIMAVVPVWSEQALGWTSTEVSNLMLTFGLSLLSVQIFIAFGKAKWLNSMAALVIACFIVIPGLALAIFWSSGWSLIILSSVIGLSSAVVNITVPATISRLSYGNVGVMLGLMSTVVLIGSTAGPMIFGLVYDYFGYRWSLFCGLISAAYATCLAIKHFRRVEVAPTLSQEQA